MSFGQSSPINPIDGFAAKLATMRAEIAELQRLMSRPLWQSGTAARSSKTLPAATRTVIDFGVPTGIAVSGTTPLTLPAGIWAISVHATISSSVTDNSYLRLNVSGALYESNFAQGFGNRADANAMVSSAGSTAVSAAIYVVGANTLTLARLTAARVA